MSIFIGISLALRAIARNKASPLPLRIRVTPPFLEQANEGICSVQMHY